MSSSFIWEDANFWEDLFYGEFQKKFIAISGKSFQNHLETVKPGGNELYGTTEIFLLLLWNRYNLDDL